MDPDAIEFFTTLAPSGVYLAGLIFALKHIAGLYQARITDKDSTFERHLSAMEKMYEARFKLLDQAATECREDRKILRGELDRLRDRLIVEVAEKALCERGPGQAG